MFQNHKNCMDFSIFFFRCCNECEKKQESWKIESGNKTMVEWQYLPQKRFTKVYSLYLIPVFLRRKHDNRYRCTAVTRKSFFKSKISGLFLHLNFVSISFFSDISVTVSVKKKNGRRSIKLVKRRKTNNWL